MVEERDRLDAPPAFLKEVAELLTRAGHLRGEGDTDGALLIMHSFWEQRFRAGASSAGPEVQRDPALADFFASFGELLLEAGLPDMACAEGWAHASKLVCGRELFSYRSAMLSSRLALVSQRLARDVQGTSPSCQENTVCHASPSSSDSALRAQADKWFQQAWLHWRVVFGGDSKRGGTFESQNPSLFALRDSSRVRLEDAPLLNKPAEHGSEGCFVGGPMTPHRRQDYKLLEEPAVRPVASVPLPAPAFPESGAEWALFD